MPLPLSVPLAAGVVQGDEPQPDTDPLQKLYADMQRAKKLKDPLVAQVVQAGIQQKLDEAMQEFQRKQSVAGTNPEQRFLAGAGGALENVGLNMADMAGSKKAAGQLAENKKPMEQLTSTGAGAAGEFVGDTAATLPIGLGVEGAVEGIGSRLLPKALRGLAGPAMRALASGAATGAVEAGPDNREAGAAQGGGTGAFLTKALQAAGKLVTGQEATKAAQLLESKGATLTPGQRNPGGWLNQGEQIAESLPFAGTVVKDAREVGREGWIRAVTEDTAAPGFKFPSNFRELPLQEQLRLVHESYGPAYNKASRGMVYPAIHDPKGGVALQTSKGGKPGALELAVMQEPYIDAATQQRVLTGLKNEQSMLPGGAIRPSVLAPVPTDAILSMRSNVREAIRARLKAGDFDGATLLRNAEHQLTQTLETQLPPKQLKLLKATDRQYAKSMLWEDAVARAKDKPPSPTNLSNATAGATNKHLYARGQQGLPEMRQMAQAGHEVLDMSNAPTGQRVLGAAAAPIALAANLPGISSVVKGQTAPQRGGQFLLRALEAQMSPAARSHARRLLPLAAGMYGGRQARPEDDE